MGSPTNKTTITLSVVAVVFIIVIIIICVIPEPCRPNDPSCQYSESYADESKGRSPATTPKDIITGTTATTTSTLTTTTVTDDSTKTSTPPGYLPDETTTSSSVSSTISSSSSHDDYYDDSTTSTSSEYTNATESTLSTSTSNATEDWNDTMSTSSYMSTESTTVSSTTSTSTSTVTPSTSTTTVTPSTTSTTTMSTYTPSSTTEMALEPDTDIPVCTTRKCRQLAARMLHMMDLGKDVNACEDFYQYSCGGMLDNDFLIPEDPQLPANRIIKEALKDHKNDSADEDLTELFEIYNSCMNYSAKSEQDRLAGAREIFDKIGYQFNIKAIDKTYSDYDYDDNDFDLTIALARMMKNHFTPFFDIMLDVAEDRTSFVFKMTLPGFKSPFSEDIGNLHCYQQYKNDIEEDKLLNEEADINKRYEEYFNCSVYDNGMAHRLNNMEESVWQLNLTDHLSNRTAIEQLISGTRTELDFLLKDINKGWALPQKIRMNHLQKEYTKATLKDLFDGVIFLDNSIDFKRFFEELMDGQDLDENTEIQIYFQSELDKTFYLLNDAYMSEKEMLQNKLLMLWSNQVYSDLVKPVGPSVGSEEYCFNAVTNLMDDYVSYLYLKNLPNRLSIEAKMDDLITDIQIELSRQFVDHGDMKDKLDTMEGNFFKKADAQFVLQQNRKNLRIPSFEDDFIQNYHSLTSHYRKRLYSLYDQEPSESIAAWWSIFLFTYRTHGVTSYALNHFKIPHAAMAPPYYYGEDYPEYINYAGIGHMIAHEIMHGYDKTGLQYDYEQKHEIIDKSLVPSTECFSEELNQKFNMTSNSHFTTLFELYPGLHINELLADSAATKLSWDTYVRSLYPEVPDNPPEHGVIQRRRKRSAKTGRPSRLTSLPSLQVPWQQRLPYLTKYSPLQLYYIKLAQNQCSATSDINIKKVMESEHLPAKLRVNLMLRNDPLFAEAFGCDASNYMESREQCYYNPTGEEKPEQVTWGETRQLY